MSDEFERWLKDNVTAYYHEELEADVVDFEGRGALRLPQARRLALHLLSLSGHAPGHLPAGELEAIRGRDRRDRPFQASDGYVLHAFSDRAALLTALDSALADLAAAEGQRDGLRLLVTDLASPEGDGREAQARCYCAGAEWERRRVLEIVRLSGLWTRADLLDLIESPPAPAAAPEEES